MAPRNKAAKIIQFPNSGLYMERQSKTLKRQSEELRRTAELFLKQTIERKFKRRWANLPPLNESKASMP